MPNSERARRRTAADQREREVNFRRDAPEPGEPVPPLPAPVGRPAFILRGLTAVVLLLVLICALLGIYAYTVNNRLGALEDYVAERRAQRDIENQELSDRVDKAVCDVLDFLPPDPTLDRIRARYECGPGQLPATNEESP